jgi:hypothetical protein
VRRALVVLVMLLCACASTPRVPTSTVAAPTAAQRAQWESGRNLLVGGVGLATVAAIFLGFSPLEVEGGSPTGTETIAVGASLGVGSAVLILLGLRAMDRATPQTVVVSRPPP